MEKKKFNGDYIGDILIIGFTGDSKKIDNFLKEQLGIIKHETEYKKIVKWYPGEKFNLENLDIIAHIEHYEEIEREELQNILKHESKSLNSE